MSEQRSLWLRPSDISTETYEDEPFLSCYLGRIFYHYEGRNAWHWTWSSTYPGHLAFHPSFEMTRRQVEKNRVQGSTWGIRELPAIVFAGKSYALMVSEINTNAPLRTAPEIAFDSRNLLNVANLFESPRPNSLVSFIASTKLAPPAEIPFSTYTSVSHGGSYRLTWRREPLKVDLQFLLQHISKLTCSIQDIKEPPGA